MTTDAKLNGGLPEVEGFVPGTWGGVNTGDDVIGSNGVRYHVASAGRDPSSRLRRLVVLEPEGGGEPMTGTPECRIPVLIRDRVTPAAKEAGVEVDAIALAVLSVHFPEMFESSPLCTGCGVLVVKGYGHKHSARCGAELVGVDA